MNLVPIDAGGAPPELIAGDAAPEGDFAALMAGLMSGDTQIVPLLDLPTGQPLSGSAEEMGGDVGTADTASILEFFAAPTAGVIPVSIGSDPVSISDAALTDPSNTEQHAPIGAAPELEPIESLPDAAITEIGEADAAITAAVATGLATVHPISNQVTPGEDAGSAAPETVAPATATPDPATAHAGTPATAEPEPDRPSGFESREPISVPVEARRPDTAMSPAASTHAETPVRNTGERHIQSNVEQTDASDAQSSQPDIDLEPVATSRLSETSRPAATISKPAMVGIARRVEDAIQALATRPDPKVVTLQLDELDGLRLTVALRPDGLHLSSTGDTALTTEIERALASRGFDMASSGDRRRQESEEAADDGWRPQPAQPGPQGRSNQSGIRL